MTSDEARVGGWDGLSKGVKQRCPPDDGISMNIRAVESTDTASTMPGALRRQLVVTSCVLAGCLALIAVLAFS